MHMVLRSSNDAFQQKGRHVALSKLYYFDGRVRSSKMQRLHSLMQFRTLEDLVPRSAHNVVKQVRAMSQFKLGKEGLVYDFIPF